MICDVKHEPSDQMGLSYDHFLFIWFKELSHWEKNMSGVCLVDFCKLY